MECQSFAVQQYRVKAMDGIYCKRKLIQQVKICLCTVADKGNMLQVKLLCI